MTLDLHYVDPRLIELYDIENPRGIDTDFYLQLAQQLKAQTIIDLGCGTGILTRELAQNRHHVIGVDPSPGMLAVARRNDPKQMVEWVEGDAGAIGIRAADLAVMTGNVAQIFLEEEAWLETLGHIQRTLKPGGYLAFESRNPTAKAEVI